MIDDTTRVEALEKGKDSFSVFLHSVSRDRKIRVIKAVRSVTNLGLKAAKLLTDNAPAPVLEDVSVEEAILAEWTIQLVGGDVETIPRPPTSTYERVRKIIRSSVEARLGDAERYRVEAYVKVDAANVKAEDAKEALEAARKAVDDALAGFEDEVDFTVLTETVQEILAELEGMTGIDGVKDQVKRLVNGHLLNVYRQEKGLPTVPIGLNIVFTGNPGTGKTTVARLIARLYKALGLVSKGHCVEVGRVDLVAPYIGQTEEKTTEVLESAKGGVLFIDEVYALIPEDSSQDYGPQVVAALVQYMENHRDELAVIVAGYQIDVERFVESNPGLQSRFQNQVRFEDFTPEELVEIFKPLAAAKQIPVSEEVAAALKDRFEIDPEGIKKGNARLVRNLFSEMFENMAIRLEENGTFTEEGVTEGFTVDDIPEVNSEEVPLPVGFCSAG